MERIVLIESPFFSVVLAKIFSRYSIARHRQWQYQIHIQSFYEHSHCKRLGIHLECALQWKSPESCTSRLVCLKNYTWRAYYCDWKRQDAKSVIETGGKQSKKRLVEIVHKHIRILTGVVTVSLVCTLSNTRSNIYLTFPTPFYLP